MNDHYVFPSLKDAMRALGLCWKPELFPETVTVLENGDIAVPAAQFVRLEEVAAAHGIAYRNTKGKEPKGRALPITDVIATRGWTFHNPLHFNVDGSRRDAESTANVDYVVGARNQQEAQRLLDLLLKFLCDDVEAAPVLFSGGAPFAHFWLISAARVPLPVLDAAPRAWWGPVGRVNKACVFAQWPWSLDVGDPNYLQRVPWKAGLGAVLFSKDEPQRLIVQAPPDQMRPLPIEGFADVQRVTTVALRAEPGAADTRFPVTLRIGPQAPADALQARVDLLDSEIAHRVREVEVLRERLEQLRAEDEFVISVPEPLLLFYSADVTEVPKRLRELLIEWTNQPGDLDALRCARFRARDLPPALDQGYAVVHAITTARALDRHASQDRTLASRLRTYAPFHAQPHFDHAPEWAEFGLRLFTPHGRIFQLHPRLRPGDAATAKLANALFGRRVSAQDCGQSLVLLVPGDRDRPIACHLPAAAFRPLAHVFEWDCAIDVEISRFAPESVRIDARAGLIEGLAASLHGAIRAEEEQALAPRRAELQQKLADDGRVLEGYDAIVQANAAASARLREIRQRLHSHLISLETTLQAVEASLADAGKGLPNAANDINALRAAATTLVREQQALAEARQQIQEIRARARSES